MKILMILSGLIAFGNAQIYQGTMSKATPPVGDMYGRTEYYNGVKVLQFLGVPYAECPNNYTLFSKPLPKTGMRIENEQIIYFATGHLWSCPQLPQWYGYGNIPVKNQSINCLHLNVYVPRTMNPKTPRAVMVFIHGGGYLYEQGMRYDGSLLAVHGHVVVVTMNYRIGAYGFLSTNDSDIPGNIGLWDQHMAMKWVKNNIAAFGGDSNRITVFGQGAGSYSINMHVLSENNTGLFQRAILQSGVALSPLGITNRPLDFAKRFADALDCSDVVLNSTDFSQKLKDCVISRNTSEVLEATLKANQFDMLTYKRVIGPVVDGDLLKDRPYKLFKGVNIPFRNVDLMVGTNSAEGRQALRQLRFYQDSHNFNLDNGVPREVFQDLFVKSIVRDFFNNSKKVEEELFKRYSGSRISDIEQSRKLVALYGDLIQHAPSVKTLRLHAELANSKRTYQYYFAHEPEATVSIPWLQGELTYIFGPEVMSPQGTNVSKEQIHFSRRMMKYWSNFAKTGNPNRASRNVWKEFTTENQHYLYLNFTPKLRRNLRSTTLEYFIQFIKEDESGAITHDVPKTLLAIFSFILLYNFS